MAFIKTINIFGGKTSVGTAGTGEIITSPPIDMRDIGFQGVASIYYTLAAGSSGTAGAGVWSYTGCPRETGTYVQMGTFGTSGTTVGAGVISWSPTVTPFMKIQVSVGTHGAKLDAQLSVR